MPLSLSKASAIIDGALDHAASTNMNPLTVAVLDAGGHLVAFKRQDRSGILRPDIAIGKAWGALGMGHGGRELARRAEQAPAFFAALASASGGRMIPAPGSVLILEDGNVIGAVGISGDMPLNDEACALAGIAYAGFTADTGGH